MWSGHFFPDQSAVVLVVAVAAVHMEPLSDLHLPHAASTAQPLATSRHGLVIPSTYAHFQQLLLFGLATGTATRLDTHFRDLITAKE